MREDGNVGYEENIVTYGFFSLHYICNQFTLIMEN